MTRTEASTESTARLTQLIALAAIVMIVALGWLMLSKSKADSDARVGCIRAQARSAYVPPECR